MKIIQSPLFYRTAKKFKSNEKRTLDNQIKKIIENPKIGVQKTGSLKEVFVYKFKIKALQYLLAYRIRDDQLELIMIGPNENYYRDLQKYLD